MRERTKRSKIEIFSSIFWSLRKITETLEVHYIWHSQGFLCIRVLHYSGVAVLELLLYLMYRTPVWIVLCLKLYNYYASTCIITVIFTPKKIDQKIAWRRERQLIFITTTLSDAHFPWPGTSISSLVCASINLLGLKFSLLVWVSH